MLPSLDFTAAYVWIEGTYLVPDSSPLLDVDDVDRERIRVAGKNTAYDLYLSRSLRHARIVHAPSSQAAIDLLLEEKADVAAGVRQRLAATAASRPGFRVMSGRFLVIEQAMALPKGRKLGQGFLHSFVEEMKVSGFISAALKRSGQGEASVAPPT